MILFHSSCIEPILFTYTTHNLVFDTLDSRWYILNYLIQHNTNDLNEHNKIRVVARLGSCDMQLLSDMRSLKVIMNCSMDVLDPCTKLEAIALGVT